MWYHHSIETFLGKSFYKIKSFIIIIVLYCSLLLLFIFLIFESLLHCHWPLPFGNTMVFLRYFTITKELPRLSWSCLWWQKVCVATKHLQTPVWSIWLCQPAFQTCTSVISFSIMFWGRRLLFPQLYISFLCYLHQSSGAYLTPYRSGKKCIFHRDGLRNFISFIYVCLRHIRSPVGITLMSASCACISDILSESLEWNRWD